MLKDTKSVYEKLYFYILIVSKKKLRNSSLIKRKQTVKHTLKTIKFKNIQIHGKMSHIRGLEDSLLRQWSSPNWSADLKQSLSESQLFLCRNLLEDPKIHMELQETLNRYNNLGKKKKKVGGPKPPETVVVVRDNL